MKKTITINIQNPQVLSSSSSLSATKGSKAVITSDEGWQISAACREDDKSEDRELAQIKIYLPKGKTFTGSIQDLGALPAVLKNAYHEVMKVAEQRFEDKKREEEVLDCVRELQGFMKLFE